MIAQERTPEQVIAQVKTNSIGLLNVSKKLLTLAPNTPHERAVRDEFNNLHAILSSDLAALNAFFNEEN